MCFWGFDTYAILVNRINSVLGLVIGSAGNRKIISVSKLYLSSVGVFLFRLDSWHLKTKNKIWLKKIKKERNLMLPVSSFVPWFSSVCQLGETQTKQTTSENVNIFTMNIAGVPNKLLLCWLWFCAFLFTALHLTGYNLSKKCSSTLIKILKASSHSATISSFFWEVTAYFWLHLTVSLSLHTSLLLSASCCVWM